MPRRLTGIRHARSLITTAVGAGSVDTDLIDFELASDQGIELVALKHIFTEIAGDLVATPFRGNAWATLHAESQTLEDPTPDVNHTVRDSEILDFEGINFQGGDDSGAAQGGMTVSVEHAVTPWQRMPDDLIVVSNMTHRLETSATMDDATSIYLIQYRYVELSAAELGLFLALRR